MGTDAEMRADYLAYGNLDELKASFMKLVVHTTVCIRHNGDHGCSNASSVVYIDQIFSLRLLTVKVSSSFHSFFSQLVVQKLLPNFEIDILIDKFSALAVIEHICIC